MSGDRKVIRLPDWDYSSEGIYFITVCCHNSEMFFGKLIDNKLILSEIGIMADKFWQEIPKHFPHVYLDEFVVMPNHIHGILVLDYSSVGPRHGVALHDTNDTDVGTCHGMSLQRTNINQFSKPIRNSVSVIINQYKSTVKRWANENGNRTFKWQSRFYDRIIREDDSIDKVREYIRMNPRNWLLDEMNK